MPDRVQLDLQGTLAQLSEEVNLVWKDFYSLGINSTCRLLL